MWASKDPAMHIRGYQYPMPQVYASGGFGYGRAKASSGLRLDVSLQSFFDELHSIEDVFVGLAARCGHHCGDL